LKFVFPTVRHQLCKFHKIKNLRKVVFKSILINKDLRKAIRLTRNIFGNTSYYGRKNAARTLEKMEYKQVSDYVRRNILTYWNNLTGLWTSNASERWNRKLNKAIFVRYGIKTEAFLEQLISALWFKEAIRDKRHMKSSFFSNMNLPEKCQEQLKVCNFSDNINCNKLSKAA